MRQRSLRMAPSYTGVAYRCIPPRLGRRLASALVVRYRYDMKRRVPLLLIVLAAAGFIAITAGHAISSEKVYILAQTRFPSDLALVVAHDSV